MSRLINAGVVLLVASLSACGSDDVVAPMPPAHLAIVSGDNQSATVGDALPIPLTVAVTTQSGAPIVGDTVLWTVTSGDGRLSANSVVSDAAGHASVNWTLGSSAGAQSVKAAVRWRVASGDNGLASFTVPFSAKATNPLIKEILALHYDGTSWTPSLTYDHEGCCGVVLNSISGLSPTAIFAAGGACYPFVMRYDGSSWHDPSTCQGGQSEYRGIWANSASDVFAVALSQYPPNTTTSIAHFDGQSWNTVYAESCSLFVSPSCGGGLRAVWARANNDAFAVGDGGKILHYDGASWTVQESGTAASLSAIWGDKTTGSALSVGSGGVILYYDGTAWRAQASGTSQALFGVWGLSPTDVFAVGDGGIILHYDGSSWTTQSNGMTNILRGVWGSSGNSVFAVGEGTILHYDGSSWAAQSVPPNMRIMAIWGSSPSNVFAVGRSLD